MVVPSRYDVPIRILRVNTRKVLSDSLNAKKILKTKDDLCRDWRGLAHLCSVTITNQSKPPADPTDYVLLKWQDQESPTISQFFEFLARLDRYDVIDDLEEIITRDVERYLHLKESVSIRAVQEEAIVNNDDQVLTIDDVCRIENGLGPQMYDAFVLYADEEWDGTKVLVDQLESDNFKLCLKDRDIVAGVSFEHKAIITLIEERCHRLLVMLSPKFIESPSNKFFHLFAQSYQIEKQMRKVIPCVYKSFPSKDDVPSEFKYYKALKYDDMIRWPDTFWTQLRNSIKSPRHFNSVNQIRQIDLSLQKLPDSASNQIDLALTSDRNSEVVSYSRDQVVTQQQLPSEGDIVECRSNSNLKTNQSSNSLQNNCVKEKLNDRERKIDLISELRLVFRLMTRKIVPNRNKETRKRDRTQCRVMS